LTLKQLENLITIDEDITDDQYGTYYDKRTVEQLLNYGVIIYTLILMKEDVLLKFLMNI